VGLDITAPIAKNQLARSWGATRSMAYSITMVSQQAGSNTADVLHLNGEDGDEECSLHIGDESYECHCYVV
jgi:hypothetical protein